MIPDHPRLHMLCVHEQIASDCNLLVSELQRNRPAMEQTRNRTNMQSNRPVICIDMYGKHLDVLNIFMV